MVLRDRSFKSFLKTEIRIILEEVLLTAYLIFWANLLSTSIACEDKQREGSYRGNAYPIFNHFMRKNEGGISTAFMLEVFGGRLRH